MKEPVNGNVDAEKLTKVYLKIKSKRDAISAEYKQQDAVLKEQQEKVKQALLEYCKDQNVESVRTTHGVFYRSVKAKYWTSDWESMYQFVLEHKVPEFFQKSLNQANVRQFLEENPDLRPMGLNVDSEYVISVRKR